MIDYRGAATVGRIDCGIGLALITNLATWRGSAAGRTSRSSLHHFTFKQSQPSVARASSDRGRAMTTSSNHRGDGRPAGATALRMLACCAVLTAGLVGALATPAAASPPSSVTGVSVATSTAAVGARAAYTVGFTTSSSGALGAGTGPVTVTFPSGPASTTVNGNSCGTVSARLKL